MDCIGVVGGYSLQPSELSLSKAEHTGTIEWIDHPGEVLVSILSSLKLEDIASFLLLLQVETPKDTVGSLLSDTGGHCQVCLKALRGIEFKVDC